MKPGCSAREQSAKVDLYVSRIVVEHITMEAASLTDAARQFEGSAAADQVDSVITRTAFVAEGQEPLIQHREPHPPGDDVRIARQKLPQGSQAVLNDYVEELSRAFALL